MSPMLAGCFLFLAAACYATGGFAGAWIGFLVILFALGLHFLMVAEDDDAD